MAGLKIEVGLHIRDIARLDLGYFTMPDRPGDPLSGQPITVCAYLIRHPRGLFLFDTVRHKTEEFAQLLPAFLGWVDRGNLYGGNGPFVTFFDEKGKELPNPVRIGTDLSYTLSVANDGPT